ncbi:MAG TPA: hypothetical protein VF532_23920 [Candidatus Angelobacter sp.]
MKVLRGTKFLAFTVLLLLADSLGTSAVWIGAPMDAPPEAAPSINSFEAWRLKYWFFFFALAGLIWLVAWNCLRRQTNAQNKFPIHKVALVVIGAGLCIGAEIATSYWYWSVLPWRDAYRFEPPFFPYHPVFHRYVWTHLISWAVVMLIGLGSWYLWQRFAHPVFLRLFARSRLGPLA